jgi:hypothetical protein
MAKLIKTDNYNRDHIADELIYDQLTLQEAQKMADEYNATVADGTDWYYQAVEDDYRLSRGMEDLV